MSQKQQHILLIVDEEPTWYRTPTSLISPQNLFITIISHVETITGKRNPCQQNLGVFKYSSKGSRMPIFSFASIPGQINIMEVFVRVMPRKRRVDRGMILVDQAEQTKKMRQILVLHQKRRNVDDSFGRTLYRRRSGWSLKSLSYWIISCVIRTGDWTTG